MITEEQQEEISEDESPFHKDIKTKNKSFIGASEAYQQEVSIGKSGEEYFYQGTDQIILGSVLNPTVGIDRLNSRIGGSRAFNQTRDNWKDQSIASEYQIQQPLTNGQNGTHSVPRNYKNQANFENESSKATNSAASLSLSKQNVTQANNNNSISPKPNKWSTNKDNIPLTHSFVGNGNAPSQKLNEMQKEVNLMYLG